jgi:flavin-dependent dehydrogenase
MEILIIGAGPAGIFCGINLLEKGIEAKIIERKKEIGKPLKCSGGISKEGIEIVDDREIIEKIKIKEFEGISLIFPNGEKIYFKRKGFLIDREKFEKLLENKFLKLGGKIIRDEIKEVQDDKVLGKNNFYKYDLLIIATGANFLKGINYPYKGFIFASEKRIISKEEKNFLEFYHGEIHRPAYMWKFYYGDFIGIGKMYKNKHDFESLNKILKEEKVIKTITGKLPFPLKPPEFLYKDKKFFIGDSGAFINQLTFAGIYGALLSAKICSKRIEKFLKNKNWGELEKFNDLKKDLIYFSKSIYKARNILYSSNDKELTIVGKLMDGKNYDEIPYIKAIKNLLKNPYFLKTYIKFLYVEKIFKKGENFSF